MRQGRARLPAPTLSRLPLERAGRQSGRRQVALIYREPHVRKVLAFWLGEAGYEVRQVNPAGPLSRARLGRPDLVLLDYDLPDDGGQRVLLALRSMAELRAVPIVAFSARDIPGERPRETVLANAWLAKPCDLGTLAIWLSRLCGSPLAHLGS